MSDSQRRRSWLLWARDLEGMAPADTAVVMELAHLADWRGERGSSGGSDASGGADGETGPGSPGGSWRAAASASSG